MQGAGKLLAYAEYRKLATRSLPLFFLPGTSRLQGWVPRRVGDPEKPQLQGQEELEALRNPENIT